MKCYHSVTYVQVNINECLMNPCMGNSTCTDTSTGYTCLCEDDRTGDNCELEKDMCADQCQVSVMCDW